MSIVFTGKGTPITRADFAGAVAALGIDEASLWTLVTVETRGFGFLPDRRPKILFERHIFHERTGGRFDRTAPDLSNPAAGGYSGGAGEYLRLQRAMALDETAALQSASWGLGQVMGFNAAAAGFDSPAAMVTAMVAGEGAQLRAVTHFIVSNPALAAAFRARQWAQVALFYNGRDYQKNHYDTLLQQHYTVFCNPAERPDLDLRTAQACLTYLGYRTSGVDGVLGPSTKASLLAFRAAHGLPPGGLDGDVMQALMTAACI